LGEVGVWKASAKLDLEGSAGWVSPFSHHLLHSSGTAFIFFGANPNPSPVGGGDADTLSEGAARLVRYHATRPLEDSEAASFLALVRAYAEVAAPYIATSFGRVYYGDTAAVHLASALTPLKQLLLLRSDVTDEAK
jgi:hypothetical protein